LTLSTRPELKGLFAEQAIKRLDQLGQILKTPVATMVE
jgi:exopolyphosphatase / guanosine-5'-triphosphate,3'-diphosphate pyrophosphatase